MHPNDIEAVLRAEGTTWASLWKNVHRNTKQQYHSGSPCPMCEAGLMRVANSNIVDGRRVRRLACNKCGYRPKGNIVVTVP